MELTIYYGNKKLNKALETINGKKIWAKEFDIDNMSNIETEVYAKIMEEISTGEKEFFLVLPETYLTIGQCEYLLHELVNKFAHTDVVLNIYTNSPNICRSHPSAMKELE